MELNENAKAWVEALKSGKYKQTKKVLTRVDPSGNKTHCCLGVACELYIQAGNTLSTDERAGIIAYRAFNESATKLLPLVVQNWLGLTTCGGTLKSGNKGSLATQNDIGQTFEEIAELIIEKKDELFV